MIDRGGIHHKTVFYWEAKDKKTQKKLRVLMRDRESLYECVCECASEKLKVCV
jgi:hypothetical protein